MSSFRRLLQFAFLLSAVNLTLAALSPDIVGCRWCNSSKSKNCVWDLAKEQIKLCQATNFTCATALLPDGHIYRGCAQDAECVDAGEQCVRCVGDGLCNNQTVPANRLSCNICTANLTNTCQAPAPGQFEKHCVRHVPDDRCVTVYDGFNVTYRDCLSAVQNEDRQRLHVVTCAGHNCNTARVRDDDRCLQCTSNMTQCAEGALIATPCTKPSGSKCYARFDERGYLVRGCWSDISGDPKLLVSCGKDDLDCTVCEGWGCNTQNMTLSKRTCLECDSRFNSHCHRPEQSASPMAYCSRQRYDRCYVRSDLNGGVIRGCLSATANAASFCGYLPCSVCDGNNCNTYMPLETDASMQCYQCDGEQSAMCNRDQEKTFGAKAVSCKPQPGQNGCYVKIYRNKIMRGCLSDVPLETNPCAGFKTTDCYVCHKHSCNSQGDLLHHNAASTKRFNPLLMGWCILIAFLSF